MTELTIDRFTSTVRVSALDSDAGTRVCRLADRVAGSRLDQAAAKAALPQGDWCVRLVEVPLVLDLNRPAVALEADWAQAVIDAIGAAIDRPGSDVVHYRRPAEALCDLLVSAAYRTTEREWAWRQMGLLMPDDLGVAADPCAALLCAMRRLPRVALSALVVAVQELGVATLHRTLGLAGWAALAEIACQALGYPLPVHQYLNVAQMQELAWPADTETADWSTPARDRTIAGVGEAASSVDRSDTERLAATIVAGSSLARAFQFAPIRPEAQLSWNWAVLVGAETDPSVFARPKAIDVIAAIASHIAGRFHSGAASVGLGATTPRQELPPARAAAAGNREPVNAPRGVADHDPDTFESAWAGLLFFLNTAADADIPNALFADDALAHLPLTYILSAIAVCIVPAQAGDPAVLAFSGEKLMRDGAAAVTDDEIERVSKHAQRWIDVTLARFSVPDKERDALLRRIVGRRAVIEADRGWVDIRIDMADVDVDVRIAGLDVDPGWVPWLGVTVRFCYV